MSATATGPRVGLPDRGSRPGGRPRPRRRKGPRRLVATPEIRALLWLLLPTAFVIFVVLRVVAADMRVTSSGRLEAAPSSAAPATTVAAPTAAPAAPAPTIATPPAVPTVPSLSAPAAAPAGAAGATAVAGIAVVASTRPAGEAVQPTTVPTPVPTAVPPTPTAPPAPTATPVATPTASPAPTPDTATTAVTPATAVASSASPAGAGTTTERPDHCTPGDEVGAAVQEAIREALAEYARLEIQAYAQGDASVVRPRAVDGVVAYVASEIAYLDGQGLRREAQLLDTSFGAFRRDCPARVVVELVEVWRARHVDRRGRVVRDWRDISVPQTVALIRSDGRYVVDGIRFREDGTTVGNAPGQ